MVNIRTLSASETLTVFPHRVQSDITEYVDALRPLAPGQAAEVELGSLTRRALKRRMGLAARQLNITLKWARAFEDDEEILVFQVRTAPASPNGSSRLSRHNRALVTAH